MSLTDVELSSAQTAGTRSLPPVTLLIPAYNEERGIGPVLLQVKKLGLPGEILVVDDGSTDRTYEAAQVPGVTVLRHDVNRGYGQSLKTGILAAKHDIIVITDADGTYPNEDIAKLLGHMEYYDMVVGARTGKTVKIPLIRKPAKKFLNLLANYLAGVDIPDLNSGLRVFRKSVAREFFNILPSGFSFTTTITLAMLSNGYRVKYVPIDYHQREGKSKIHPIRDTIGFTNLIVRTTLYFNPLKIFMPLSGIVLLAAIVLLVYSKFVLGRVMDISVIVLLSAALQIAVIGMLADLIDKRGHR
ncbi:MAG: glycosyltransferase family 2 protein [Candidatus Eisenbacteria bacterium]|nr:glycosyltransferase family 2 protein [Candidatus Eisenbacteria bacterium]